MQTRKIEFCIRHLVHDALADALAILLTSLRIGIDDLVGKLANSLLERAVVLFAKIQVSTQLSRDLVREFVPH